MHHLSSISDMQEQSRAWRAEGATIGFVPTMGALHEGHLSLVAAARKACDKVVVSIFVNPTQFGPDEDLDTYPRDLERDSRLLAQEGCDLVFTTTPGEMYPEGFNTWVTVETLTDGLCGASRAGHFRGVTTVVLKLLQIVGPQRAFFGEKDRQQLVVLTRMARDLNLQVEVIGCPIVREPDGLARSSRNAYLSPDERQRARALSAGLRAACAALAGGERDARALEGVVRKELEEARARVDYVSAVDPETLQPVERADGRTIIAVAAFLGATRLIDNHVLGVPFPEETS